MGQIQSKVGEKNCIYFKRLWNRLQFSLAIGNASFKMHLIFLSAERSHDFTLVKQIK